MDEQLSSLMKKSVTVDSRLRANDRLIQIRRKSSFPRRRESIVPIEQKVIQQTASLFSRLLTLLILCLFLTNSGEALAEPRQPDFILGGEYNAVVTLGSMVYLAEGSSLVAADISSGTAPVIKSRIRFSEGVWDLDSLNDRFLAVTLDSGLWVYDTAGSATPTLVKQYPARTRPRPLASSGNHAFMVRRAKSIQAIYQVTGDASPELVTTIDPGMYTMDLAFHGDLACIIGSNRNYDPRNTKGLLVVFQMNAEKACVQTGTAEFEGFPAGISMSDHLAVVTTRTQGILLYNLTDPAKPVQVAHIELKGIKGRAHLSGSYLFVSGTGATLSVFDISDLASPKQVSTYGKASASYLSVSKDRACVITGTVEVLDVTDPQQLKLIAKSPPAFVPTHLAIADDLLLVTTAKKDFQVYSMGPDASLSQVGSLHLPAGALSIAVTASHAYVPFGEQGMGIIDISNPSAPRLARHERHLGAITRAILADHMAYLPAKDGLRIADLTNLERPKLKGFYVCEDCADNFTINFPYGYMMSRNVGLQTIDIRYPISTVFMSLYPQTRYGAELASRGALVCVGIDGEKGRSEIYDLADPNQANLLKTFEGTCRCMQWIGQTLYIGQSGLVTSYNTSDIHNIVEQDTFKGIRIVDLAVSGSHLVLADQTEGLVSFDLTATAEEEK